MLKGIPMHITPFNLKNKCNKNNLLIPYGPYKIPQVLEGGSWLILGRPLQLSHLFRYRNRYNRGRYIHSEI